MEERMNEQGTVTFEHRKEGKKSNDQQPSGI
ncbi:hypothetical protein HMPREF9138_01377 [Prevotella histicola F0411]|uniref:Uncharacterized protein n=1 Tax=Prevotella histicola F0411 TaxID=857291 RepID=G6AGF6_9BACT|nr:hypothetical protein HMPREF9138_01377 [Prevotella histicola F0411]